MAVEDLAAQLVEELKRSAQALRDANDTIADLARRIKELEGGGDVRPASSGVVRGRDQRVRRRSRGAGRGAKGSPSGSDE
jgi:hypothetical protein